MDDNDRLVIASRSGNLDELLNVLRTIRRPDLKKLDWNKCLWCAIKANSHKVASLIVSFGGKVSMDVIKKLCQEGNIKMVDIIISQFDSNLTELIELIEFSAFYGQEAIVDLLLSHNPARRSAFLGACSGGHSNLIEKYKDPKYETDGLKIICKSNRVDLLKHFNADLNIGLDHAGSIQMIQALVDLGATDASGALVLAASFGRYEIVGFILNLFDKKIVICDPLKAMHKACLGYITIIEILEKYIQHADWYQCIYIAVETGSKILVNRIIHHANKQTLINLIEEISTIMIRSYKSNGIEAIIEYYRKNYDDYVEVFNKLLKNAHNGEVIVLLLKNGANRYNNYQNLPYLLNNGVDPKILFGSEKLLLARKNKMIKLAVLLDKVKPNIPREIIVEITKFACSY
jgi:hypothetical protein